jgi:dTMP kinase
MGHFLSFEGIDGCGKTTQIILLENYLASRGVPVVTTREPGGTEVSESIRQVLLASQNTSLLPRTELLLYYASRHQNLFQKILPSLEQGSWVLCDRYADASMAYQGYGRGLDLQLISYLDQAIIQRRMPDLTFLIDIAPAESLRRARLRNQSSRIDEGRFEKESLSFFEKVRRGYLEIARQEPERFRVLDGRLEIESIHQAIRHCLEPLLGRME